jgi:thiamine-phosphate pyrophosphorylase
VFYNQSAVADNINRTVLRLLDANANRAREAMRVIEDYARFVLNSTELSTTAKNLRHEMAQILAPILNEAIVHRDTPGDVGTVIKTPSEQSRADLPAVVVAAGKRAGEALRAIEEFLKTFGPAEAGKIEAIRYRFYHLERRIILTLRPGERVAGVRLCVMITESACKKPWLQTAELAIEGGADCLQLREKTIPDGELLRRATELAALCRRRGVLCIINDRADIAVLAEADGVHVGQEDLPAAQVRLIVGNRGIVGVSTHNLAQAARAVADGADYIGVGPIFKSSTKPRDFVAGLEYAAAAAREVAIPKFAVAGIGLDNIDQVLASGIGSVAVTAAVVGCDDPAGAAREFKRRIERKSSP